MTDDAAKPDAEDLDYDPDVTDPDDGTWPEEYEPPAADEGPQDPDYAGAGS